jgi:transposase-like protein
MTLITLNYQEYKALEQFVSPTKNAMHLRRAQALLWLDGGESVLAVADRLRVSRRTIYNWVNRFQDSGVLDLSPYFCPKIGPLLVEAIERILG